jgi:hypothetical protein
LGTTAIIAATEEDKNHMVSVKYSIDSARKTKTNQLLASTCPARETQKTVTGKC